MKRFVSMVLIALGVIVPSPAITSRINTCKASWYQYPRHYSTAHKTLPFGTHIAVFTVKTPRRRITVTVRDRGPYVAGRCLDLDSWSFSKLAPLGTGVISVYWKVVK